MRPIVVPLGSRRHAAMAGAVGKLAVKRGPLHEDAHRAPQGIFKLGVLSCQERFGRVAMARVTAKAGEASLGSFPERAAAFGADIDAGGPCYGIGLPPGEVDVATGRIGGGDRPRQGPRAM